MEQRRCASPSRSRPSDATILITGESGTGKEVMARYIHRKSTPRQAGLSSRSTAPRSPRTCSNRELFGHEKGAFTGAVARRIGKFEEANGGTLLLDEISEMDPRLQAKLLRAIQEREIDRVGGTQPIKVDIRIIATSNRDLEDEVRDGSFREDLYFRLNVVNLRIPPLRERPRTSRRWPITSPRNTPTPTACRSAGSRAACARCCARHAWRGNVRELENTMHRAVLLAQARRSARTRSPCRAPSRRRRGRAARAASGRAAGLVGRTVADVERDLILETLQHCLGNRTHAANILGISIRTLRNKLQHIRQEGVAVPLPASAERVTA